MPKLNFLRRKKARQPQFYTMLCAALAMGGVCVVGLNMVLDQGIAQQSVLVQILHTAHHKLDAQLGTATGLQAQIADLVQRRQRLETLRQQQHQAALLLQTLAQKTPANVHLNTLQQQATHITLSGSAATPENVMQLLQNLRNGNSVLQNAELQEIHATPAATPPGHNFIIAAPITPATPTRQ